jgi:hypothetical protein
MNEVVETLLRLISEGQAAQGPPSLTIELINVGEEVRTFQVTCQSLLFNFNQCVILNLIEITQSKKLALMEFQRWRYKVRESSVSHELITPLRCLIKLSSDLLSDAEFSEKNK